MFPVLRQIQTCLRPTLTKPGGLIRLPAIRHLHKSKTEKVVPVGSSFYHIYKLPQITVCALINKLKRYQLIAVGAATPVVVCLNALNLCDNFTLIVFPTVGVASTAALFAMGQVFTNLVGMVYVSKDRSRVKISFSDFWGQRHDKILSISDIKGLSPKSLLPLYEIQIADEKEKYNINLKHGEILITELFKTALKYDPDAKVPIT